MSPCCTATTCCCLYSAFTSSRRMLSPASTRPRHRRASSSPQYPTRDNNTPKQMPSTSDDVNHPPSPRPWAASRIIHSVKRTLVPSSGPKKRHPEYSVSHASRHPLITPLTQLSEDCGALDLCRVAFFIPFPAVQGA